MHLQFWKADMSEEEAKTFIVKAISHAMARDASSGGCIRTVIIDASGVRREFLPGSQVGLGLDVGHNVSRARVVWSVA